MVVIAIICKEVQYKDIKMNFPVQARIKPTSYETKKSIIIIIIIRLPPLQDTILQVIINGSI